MNKKLDPCAFCRTELSGPTATGYYLHAKNDCILSEHEISLDEVDAWNRRAALTPSGAAQTPIWQPIETVPKDGSEVALLFPAEVKVLGETRPRVRAASWRVDWTIPYLRDNAPTHWAPMPLAPNAVPGAPAAAASINLEGLRKRLLTPRKILRDESGWLTHPDYPICDEGTRADKLLEAFGIETAFVSMESDLPEFAERWHEEGLSDCSEWTPMTPAGDGWILLAIYDTEDGPWAMFGRDKYESENALKRQRTRELSERIQKRQANQGDKQ